MYKRKYSLKNKYEFSNIFKAGETKTSPHLILKFTKSVNADKLFGIVASTKFSKSAVIRNKLKRLVSTGINDNLSFVPSGKYVFIPKKNILGQNGKINVDGKTISTEINTLLSKMDIL